ncbi:hypothetical protein [Geminocystis sp.]|uniref:hypothetical protein n=1 Tax=Geminocystis sp. TaxID=2664100 RepID=UPI003593EEF6
MDTNLKDRNVKQVSAESWYSRPLWGNQSFLAWFQSLFASKQEIPETTQAIYRDCLNSLKNISTMAKAIDDNKFNSGEFVKFLMINRQFEQNIGAYEGLKDSIDLLKIALETKESFLKIEATETRYRSYAQQEFYEYVLDLLQKKYDAIQFKELIERKLTDIIPQIKSDEGKTAIQAYVNSLEIVAKNNLGLKLLYLFKQYDLSNFALLRTVGDIADTFYDKNLDSIKEFMVMVQVNADVFLKLGQIIEVPTPKNNPETYALMLQYIALKNRHGKSYDQFQSLLGLLREWEKFYNPLIAIRQEYPPEEFKQPILFGDDIPGLAIYGKYESMVN